MSELLSNEEIESLMEMVNSEGTEFDGPATFAEIGGDPVDYASSVSPIDILRPNRISSEQLRLAEKDRFDTFAFVPYVIDVHEEAAEWSRLKERLRRGGTNTPLTPLRGLGIPFGGAVICHPNHRLEVVDQPAVELTPDASNPDANTPEGSKLVERQLMPD